jgi:dCMP deaminase
MNKFLLAYVPVLHLGYVEFLRRHRDALAFYVWGEDILCLFDHLYQKDIRALKPEMAASAIRSLGIVLPVDVASLSTFRELVDGKANVVMPDEDESQILASTYLDGCTVEFDTVFLRRDKTQTVRPSSVNSDKVISVEGFSGYIMTLAYQEARKSSDWWRRVGAVAMRGTGILLVAHNRHVPSPHVPYAFGDPRLNFNKGTGLEFYTSLHAEAGIIAEAARRGDISLEGADLYVTTFPCPSCAKQLAYTGIKRLFFHEGYSVLDGESILKARGIEIIRIE